MKKFRSKKMSMIILSAIVILSASGIIAVTPTPAEAWSPECIIAAEFGWHSWGANISCIYSIIANIIEEDWD